MGLTDQIDTWLTNNPFSEPDWDGQGAAAVTTDTLLRTRLIATIIDGFSFNFSVGPTPGGDLWFELDQDSNSMIVSVSGNPDEEVGYYVEWEWDVGDSETFIDLINKIKTYRERRITRVLRAAKWWTGRK